MRSQSRFSLSGTNHVSIQSISHRMRTSIPLLVALVAMLAMPQCHYCTADEKEPDEDAFLQAKPDDLQWFREARFGLFVCWGPVSLVGTEIGWSRGGIRRGMPSDHPEWGDLSNTSLQGCPVEKYDNLFRQFDAAAFDADQWVDLIKQAGMKYVIFLTKHHDGFCMFDSSLTEYDIMSTPLGRDVTRELADACHRAGIRICWYYSQPDWHHPDYYTENHERYIEYLHGQIRELLTNYGKIDVIWFDGLFCTEDKVQSRELLKMIRTLQPGILVNNRIGGLPGDFVTPEQTIGRYQEDPPWESCITLGTQWSWKPQDEVKSLQESLQTLIRCAGGDGNLAYNVGPMPDGRIEERQADVLRGMGDWLRQYGQTIYGTRGGPFLPGRWGASTRADKTIYLHVMDWSQDELHLPPLNRSVVRSSLLNSPQPSGSQDNGGEVFVHQNEEGITIRVAKEFRNETDTIVALEMDGPVTDLKPRSMPSGSLAVRKAITASSVWGSGYEPALAFDDDDTTRWGAAPGSRSGWLEVDLGADRTFQRAVINQEGWNRIREFELQRWNGNAWETFYVSPAGESVAGKVNLEFPPVTARRVRLNIPASSDVITIWEFQLFPP